MGGDHAPAEIVAGALAAARGGASVVLVGPPDVLRRLIPPGSSLPIVEANNHVGMAEGAAAGVRRAEDSSVRVAMRLVRDGQAGAVVSCGNTGAVLIAAKVDLGVLDGVDRPPLATVLPRVDGGRLILLDAGANVDCRPEQLVSFAHMGAAYAEILGIAQPRVGLLSNGEEDGKGNAQVRAALQLLRATDLTVVGNVEPGAAMEGQCDVLVTDGFVGNVLLKAAEGAVSTVVQLLRAEILRSPVGRAGAWLLRGAFARFRAKVAWDAHGGALLLGTRGPVIVGHGRAHAAAVEQAIYLAGRVAESDLVGRLALRLASFDLPAGKS
jgi:phosphate acyltransferase